MSNREHQPGRARERAGRELAWAILAGVALGLAITFAPSLVYATQSTHDVVKTDMRTLVQVSETWQFDHPGDCPTVARLKRDGALERDQIVQDPWGNPYVIFCPHDDDLIVLCAGRDGRYGTGDDQTVGAVP